MHDPCTVAFEIKYPWRGAPSKFWPKGYRSPFVTIWHIDPESDGSDDSCGWSRPKASSAESVKFCKIGAEQYHEIFRQRAVMAEGDPERYAYVCYEPSCYDAVYWAWRRIKREDTKQIWQYGGERGDYLTAAELEQIYSLSACPVDNLRVTVAGIKNEDDCADFFMLVYRAYRRFNRPRFKHPRWHFWHWRFQVHPWQALRRWLFSRCAGCGKRFPYGYSPVSFQWHKPRPKLFRGEVGVYHSECSECVVRAGSAPQSTAVPS